MKSVLVAVALTVGLAACSPAHTQEERTPHTNAIPGLEHWVPAKYTYTQDDTLPPNYVGVDIWKARDFFEVLNRFRLRHHDDESQAEYRRRALQNDLIAPFDYESEYAFLADQALAEIGGPRVHCSPTMGSTVTATCLIAARRILEYEPSSDGPDGEPTARVMESLYLALTPPDLRLFSNHLVWHGATNFFTISVDTNQFDVDPDEKVGLLMVGRIKSPYRRFIEEAYKPTGFSWKGDLRDGNQNLVLPSISRHSEILFEPTRLVAYVIATGEILAEIRPKPD